MLPFFLGRQELPETTELNFPFGRGLRNIDGEYKLGIIRKGVHDTVGDMDKPLDQIVITKVNKDKEKDK